MHFMFFIYLTLRNLMKVPWMSRTRQPHWSLVTHLSPDLYRPFLHTQPSVASSSHAFSWLKRAPQVFWHDASSWYTLPGPQSLAGGRSKNFITVASPTARIHSSGFSRGLHCYQVVTFSDVGLYPYCDMNGTK